MQPIWLFQHSFRQVILSLIIVLHRRLQGGSGLEEIDGVVAPHLCIINARRLPAIAVSHDSDDQVIFIILWNQVVWLGLQDQVIGQLHHPNVVDELIVGKLLSLGLDGKQSILLSFGFVLPILGDALLLRCILHEQSLLVLVSKEVKLFHVYIVDVHGFEHDRHCIDFFAVFRRGSVARACLDTRQLLLVVLSQSFAQIFEELNRRFVLLSPFKLHF